MEDGVFFKANGSGFEVAALGGRQLELVDLADGNEHEGWAAWGLIANLLNASEVLSETENAEAESVDLFSEDRKGGCDVGA